MPEIIKLDLPVFGADRKFILCHLSKNFPEYCFYNIKNNIINSYCLGRSGSNFEHIGPVIADNEEEALNLISKALENCQGKQVIIDIFEEKATWFSMLKELGFQIQRPFIRMHLGELKHPGEPDKQFAIAGPELG